MAPSVAVASVDRSGFYLRVDGVRGRYSGPFDLKTWEWINASGTFPREDFSRGILELLDAKQCELRGNNGEKLRLTVLPSETVALDLRSGYANNLSIADLGISPKQLVLPERFR